MKTLFTILVLQIITVIAAFGQLKPKYATPKFDFTQIDSIVKANQNILDTDSFFIAHQIWNIGSRISGKAYSYDNPFELLFYYKQNENYYIKKINNLDISKTKKHAVEYLIKFLEKNLVEMQREMLSIKVDTLDLKIDTLVTGDITKSYRTVYSTTDYQREDQVWISFKGKELRYNFPAEYVNNKYNLTKKQYLFLEILKTTTNKSLNILTH